MNEWSGIGQVDNHLVAIGGLRLLGEVIDAYRAGVGCLLQLSTDASIALAAAPNRGPVQLSLVTRDAEPPPAAVWEDVVEVPVEVVGRVSIAGAVPAEIPRWARATLRISSVGADNDYDLVVMDATQRIELVIWPGERRPARSLRCTSNRGAERAAGALRLHDRMEAHARGGASAGREVPQPAPGTAPRLGPQPWFVEENLRRNGKRPD